jgi:hypothetical protein
MPRTMDIRLEHTEGLGRAAQVWVDGSLLTVCDNLSPVGARMPPGPLEAARFAYVVLEEFSWRDAVGGNPSRRKQLDHVRKWSYTGYGRVVSIMPVVIDFGLLTMEDPNWSTDESLIGRYVKVQMDRLEVHPPAAVQ